jgi:AsmA protein
VVREGQEAPLSPGAEASHRHARSLRIIVFGVIGLVGLLIVGATALFFVVDTGAYKARLESAASQASGMEVRVGGRMRIALFPGLRVTLEDLHVRNRGMDVLSAKEARLAIDLMSLLRKEIRVERIALQSPSVSIERDRQGRFNVETTDAAAGAWPSLDWPSVSLTDATLVYADKQSGDAVQAAHCRLDLHRLRLAGGTRSNLLKALSFTAELACAQVRSEGYSMSDLKSSAEAKDGVLDVTPLTTRVFGTQGSGSVRADFSGAVPSYRVRYSLLQFPIEEFFKTTSLKKVAAAGRMDFSADVSMQGTSAKQLRQTAKGRVSLRGRNLTLVGVDLDGQLSRFESSQNFNLVDVGAFFFAGPLGLAVTKGYSFASIFQETGTRSEIRTLVSDWQVDRGVAHAHDVAMATKENRIALQGGLDVVNDRFDDVTVAVVDAKGCATVQQKVHGTFQNPVVDKPSLLASLTGPALSLLKKGRDLFRGGRCDVFYAGSVAAPT